MPFNKGFTLLEIMLVLILVGMVSVGVVMTLPNSVHLDKTSQWHAERFSMLLQQIEDQALISNLELGIEFSEQSYQFTFYDLKQKKWLPFHDSQISNIIQVPLSISTEYILSGSVWDEIDQEDDNPFIDSKYLVSVQDNEREVEIHPQVFIMSSGEVTPFSYRFYDSQYTVIVKVGMSGQITLINE